VNLLRLVLLGLAALAGIVAGAALLQKAIRPARLASPLTATASTRDGEPGLSPFQIAAAQHILEEELKTAPEYAVFFERLKSLFPLGYESFLAGFSRRLALGGNMGSVDFLISDAVRSLHLSHGGLAAKAGNLALEHIFELQVSMVGALAAKDPHLCVAYLNGGGSAGLSEFSAQIRGLVAAMGIADLDAIHDGEVQQVERLAPADTDFDALEKALRAKGLDTPEIEALLDGKISNPPVAEAKMCQAGEIYLETLAAMPEPERLRIYGFAVELMSRP